MRSVCSMKLRISRLARSILRLQSPCFRLLWIAASKESCKYQHLVAQTKPGSHQLQINPDSTPYLQSKRKADAFLLQADLGSNFGSDHGSQPDTQCNYLILRPSVVVGIDGASSKLFRTLASLPIISIPGKGGQRLQPVHVDDVVWRLSDGWAINTVAANSLMWSAQPRSVTDKC